MSKPFYCEYLIRRKNTFSWPGSLRADSLEELKSQAAEVIEKAKTWPDAIEITFTHVAETYVTRHGKIFDDVKFS